MSNVKESNLGYLSISELTNEETYVKIANVFLEIFDKHGIMNIDQLVDILQSEEYVHNKNIAAYVEALLLLSKDCYSLDGYSKTLKCLRSFAEASFLASVSKENKSFLNQDDISVYLKGLSIAENFYKRLCDKENLSAADMQILAEIYYDFFTVFKEANTEVIFNTFIFKIANTGRIRYNMNHENPDRLEVTKKYMLDYLKGLVSDLVEGIIPAA